MIIQPIVEGQGEEAAFPVLLRRLRNEAEAWGLDVGRPHRRKRTQLVAKETLQTAVQVAALEAGCAGILILFDADDDCPKELAPLVQRWANEVAGTIPCAVVMATREYEAWFLADIEGIRHAAPFRDDATSHPEPEGPRDAKGELDSRMVRGSTYSATVDQASMSAAFELGEVYRRCRSFRRLVSAFGELARASGVDMAEWPPVGWR